MKVLDMLGRDWAMATEIHKLESRLWKQAREGGLKVILFTSAIRGEGKSTTVACVAASASMYEGRRVLVVDLDFRIPRLNEYLNLEVPCGLAEVLRGDATLDEAILHTQLPGLDVLLPSPHQVEPELLLNTPKLLHEFRTLRDRYDLILLDVPAVIPVADTSRLIPLSDGVVLVVMAGKSTKPQLSRARELCLGMGANLLGLVVGNVQEALPDYLDTSYYYGYRPSAGEGDVGETERS